MSHATLPPSGAARWLACPGSIALIDKADRDGSAIYGDAKASKRGTWAHAVAEDLLRNGGNAKDWLGQIRNGLMFDADMAANVQIYVDYVRELALLADDVAFEAQVTFADACWGTADALVLIGDTLHVVDFKYGRSRVAAARNPQLMIYAASAVASWAPAADAASIVLHVVQPRIADGFTSCTLTRSDLDIWSDAVLVPGIAAATSRDPELIAGDAQCRWCPARGICPARQECALDQLPDALHSPFVPARPAPPPAPASFAPVKPSAVLQAAPIIHAWCGNVQNVARPRPMRTGRLPTSGRCAPSARVGGSTRLLRQPRSFRSDDPQRAAQLARLARKLHTWPHEGDP